MSKQHANDKLQNALTVIQSVTPPFLPPDAEVMTVVIEWPPGDPGMPPHRHPGGPAFGYVLEGEMVFELEGELPRVDQGRRGILGTRRRRHPLSGRQQPRRHAGSLRRHHDVCSRSADARRRRR